MEVPRLYRRPFWLMESVLVPEAPSPDERWFASVKDGNVVLRAAGDDQTRPLTTDGTPECAWDIEGQRHKVCAGMNVEQRMLDPWSPHGDWLFAIKVDRRAVPDLPFVRYLGDKEQSCSIKIQRAGGPLDVAHPCAIDVAAKRARRFDLGDTEDRYFTLIGWLPDGSQVLFSCHSRDFKTVAVLAGNPSEGSVRTILSERAETFVAIQHDVIFGGDNHVTLLRDGLHLIWRSSRSGWNHFYLYAMDGSLIRALTWGDFPVIDVLAVDQERDWVYFTAHHDEDRPYDTHLCRVPLTGGEIQRLTPRDGQNSVSLRLSEERFTVGNSRPDRPLRTDVHACDGKHLATLGHAKASSPEVLPRAESEEFTVKAADGKTELWGVMHRPANFDLRKKYPVIDHLYAGPQVAMVNRHFGVGEESQKRIDHSLAQLGFIVISVDARGTPERSKAFHDVVYRNWGRHEIPDHAATIQQLAERHSYIDLNRIGVWGHSWGGYFTIRALAQAPDIFRVGVASAPGADPRDAILYEPYLDLPTRAREAYDYATLYSWACRIKGQLLLLAGTCDPLVYSNTLKMVHHLIEAGVDHELVMLPEALHGYTGRDDEYFVQKLVGHFERHLKARSS